MAEAQQSAPQVPVENVVNFYEKMLAAFGVHFDQNGLLSIVMDSDTVTPAIVEDKRLVMPTSERLAKPLSEGLMYFHPLSESSVRGESAVFRFIKTLTNFRLNSIMIIMLELLAQLATDPEKQKSLGNQLGLLSTLADPPAKAYDKMIKLINNSDLTSDKRFINVFIKQGGTLNNEPQARLATVNFPLLSKLLEGEKEVWGVDLTKNERQFLINLHKVLLPSCDEDHAYSCGSRNSAAPAFDACISAFIKVVKALNSTVWAFRKHVTDVKSVHVNLEWEKSMKHIDKLKMQIPPLEGNIGDLAKGAVDAQVKPQPVVNNGAAMFSAVASVQPQVVQQQVVQQPVQQPTQMMQYGNGGIMTMGTLPMTKEQQEIAEWNAALATSAMPAVMPQATVMGNTMMGFQQANIPQFAAADSSAQPAQQQPQQQAVAPVQGQQLYDQAGRPVMVVPAVPAQQMNMGWGQPQQMWGQPQGQGIMAGFNPNQNSFIQPQQAWGQTNGWGTQPTFGGVTF